MAPAATLEDHGDKATCALCHRQVARYSCPSCNVPYCSLSCFRTEKHNQCSEGFYKRELEAEIRTKPSASMDERRQMMEMLRRLELDEDEDEASEESEDAKRLRANLEDVDIESATFSQLWSALSQEQRESFMETVGKPDSESARELLRGFESDVSPPWWERANHSLSSSTAQIEAVNRPKMFEIQSKLLDKRSLASAQPLLYNICAVLIAYAYVSRYLNLSPLVQISSYEVDEDTLSARHILSDLIPHVTERSSRVLFTSMDAVIFDLWPRLVDAGKASHASFALFVRDASKLLTPDQITPVAEHRPTVFSMADSNEAVDLEALPQSTALLALSDLIELFRMDKNGKTRETHSSAKLIFYAMQIAVLPAPLLKAFAAEVNSRASALEVEERETGDRGLKVVEQAMARPLIQEL